jgi:uncharacterized delta-60 repeat protein
VIATLTATLLVLVSPADSSPRDRQGAARGQLRLFRYASAHAFSIRTDGKLVAAGWWSDYIGKSGGFGLARYTRNGSIDASFGRAGKVLNSFGSGARDPSGRDFSHHGAEAVVIQPDGKIVAAGSSSRSAGRRDEQFALARYRNDGSPDARFGSGGKVLTSFGSYSGAVGVVLQRNGKLLAAGWSGKNDGHLVLARYLRNGHLDASFGHGGKVENGSLPGAGAVALQPDGKIVILCSSYRSRARVALARYNTDGTLDLTFGRDGAVSTGFFAFALAIQRDGKIVAAGSAGDSEHPDFALARYVADGSLDLSFGRAGTVLTDFNRSSEGVSAIAIQANGKLVAFGSSDALGYMPLPNEPPHADFALARYTANGALDTSFGRRGKVLTTADRSGDLESFTSGVAIRADGKIIAVGSRGPEDDQAPHEFLLVRYSAHGRLDGSFGHGGRATTNFSSR